MAMWQNRNCAECEKPTERGNRYCSKCQRKQNLKHFVDSLDYCINEEGRVVHEPSLLSYCQSYEVWRYDDPSFHISEKAAIFITFLKKRLGWIPTQYHCRYYTLALHFGYLCDTPTLPKEEFDLDF